MYKGYVDDPRNTDNAWIETVATNFHDSSGSALTRFQLKVKGCVQPGNSLKLSLYKKVCMEKVAGLQILPSSKFSHANLLSISQLQSDVKVDIKIRRTWNFACRRSFSCPSRLWYSKAHQGRFFSHVENFGSCDQLLQKAYCSSVEVLVQLVQYHLCD